MKNPDMNQIYEEYADVVYGFILRMCHDENLAEDILQDTFLKAIEKINTFDQKCKLTTWLCQIAKNTYFDYLRKIKKCEEVLLDEMLTCDRNNLPEDVAISKENKQEILSLIHKLQEPYKEVFLLRFYAELSFKEIARIFGKSEVWGRVTYLRSKDMLLEFLQNVNDDKRRN